MKLKRKKNRQVHTNRQKGRQTGRQADKHTQKQVAVHIHKSSGSHECMHKRWALNAFVYAEVIYECSLKKKKSGKSEESRQVANKNKGNKNS